MNGWQNSKSFPMIRMPNDGFYKQKSGDCVQTEYFFSGLGEFKNKKHWSINY